MRRKLILISVLAILLTSLLSTAFRVKKVQASGTIYIRADGRIDPPTANITTSDDVTYTFTDNNYDAICVERSNIIIDGAGYTLYGTGAYDSRGIDLSWSTNVTILNVLITTFEFGVLLLNASNCTISCNTMMNSRCGILLSSSTNNTIHCNNLTENYYFGIWLEWSSNINDINTNNITNNENGIGLILHSDHNNLIDNTISENVDGVRLSSSSDYNTISGNTITYNNRDGVVLHSSSNNTVSGNTVTANGDAGVVLDSSSNNTVSANIIADCSCGIRTTWSGSNEFYHNYFINNTVHVNVIMGDVNAWDDGYPSGGNYWSDYEEMHPEATELDGSGLWDTPYVIDDNNQDRYPIIPECSSVLMSLVLMILTPLIARICRTNSRALRKKR